MLFQALVLMASALGPHGSASPEPITAYLVPVDEGVLGKEYSAAQLEKTLRDRLVRRAGLRLADEMTRGAMRLQVTGCAHVEESGVKKDGEGHPPVTLPPGLPRSRAIVERGEEHGASIEKRSFVILFVRVTWEDETREFTSGEDDLTLQAAVSAVVREIEKLVKRKRR